MNPIDQSPPAPGTRPTFRIPVRLLLADAVGTAMVVLGVLLLATDYSSSLPWDIDYSGLGAGLVIGGILMMLPMIWHFVRRARIVTDRKRMTGPVH